jgi:hypothetical protein
MNHTDPTYLRAIHDGLLLGTIHKDNASNLPIGLIGMYEQALPPAINVNKRKKFLEFFSVWALLKKEVSAAFVVPLLEGWTEEHVLDYISEYSKWFNSTVSGKYVLYHERFRSFVIQKISQMHFTTFNESIIQNCRTALQVNSGNEWEHYALEHLSLHLLIQAMESKDSAALKTLAYDITHWNRQVEVSKGFDWSKRMLNDMMLWASKYDDEEVVECSLNKVDLHHQEQNDAPRIVELVAQNDIETALQRIEAFGGNNEEGLQRKFILYMLCLMEVTLLDSKDKTFRKDAIDKLLKDLDDNMPVDHSVLNWDDFFPSYLMFLMACEWAELGLDYLKVYKRTVEELDKISPLHYNVTNLAKQGNLEEAAFTMKEALACAEVISDESEKTITLTDISTELAKQGKLEEALAFAMGISDDYRKNSALKDISNELAKQGKFEEALECAQGISDGSDKSSALKEISTELAKQGKIEKALEHTSYIIDEFDNVGTLREISNAIDNIDILYMALDKIKKTRDDSTKYQEKGEELKLIAIEFHKRGLYHIYLPLLNDSLNLLSLLSYDWSNKGGILEQMAIELAAIGELKDAYKVIGKLRYLSEKESTLKNISNQQAKSGNLTNSSIVLMKLLTINKDLGENEIDKLSIEIAINLSRRNFTDNALTIANSICNDWDNAYALWQIALECISQDNFEIGFEIALSIRDINHIDQACEEIANELIKRDYINEALDILQRLADSIDYCQSSILIELSGQLFSQNKIEDASLFIRKAHECIPNRNDDFKKVELLLRTYSELIKHGDLEQAASAMQDAFECTRCISDESEKSTSLLAISSELAKQGRIEEAAIAMHEVLEFTRGISDDSDKSSALNSISIAMAVQGKIKEALECVQGISDDSDKSSALESISIAMAVQGKIKEALECAQGISDDSYKSSALESISIEMAVQGKIEEALKCAQAITDNYSKFFAIEHISTELTKQGKIGEALECARGLTDDSHKSSALQNISFELAKQGNWPLAEKIGLEISTVDYHFKWGEKIAKLVAEQDGWQKALEHISNFKNQDTHKYYLKGLAELLKTSDFDKTLLLYARGYYQNNIVSIETLLQHHALHELFFSDATSEKIERFNRSLNIQWAIDIQNSFSDN